MAVFVDTNVLLYAIDRADPEKFERAQGWLASLWERRAGRVSVQVLKEFYVNATRKLSAPLTRTEAAMEVRELWAWNPQSVSSTTMEHAWRIEGRFGLSFWDALIVASATDAGCRHLLTEDLQHDQDLGGVRVIDPFRVAPADILD